MTAPLCDGGRCEQILAGIAEARTMERLGEQYGQALVAIIEGVLSEFGLDVSDQAVRTVVARHVRRVLDASRTQGTP